ncbi:MAG: iron chelate uptake ABC transporter family permease subunit [Oscillospiraceae bacterium]|nr:iron chelate uptake ABC transporter family permease subunit [Oscillospiraceae bacterium]
MAENFAGAKPKQLWLKFLSFAGPGSASTQAAGSKKRSVTVFVVLAVLLVAAMALYLYSRTWAKMLPIINLGIPVSPDAFSNILARAIPHLVAMVASAVVLAVVSLSFQTITQSRVLTPSMIGFDSVFVGTQTALVFIFGASHVLFANPLVNFLVSAGVMIAISFFMFGFILRSSRNNIVFLLMFGLVLSGIISSGTRYLQIIMNQSEFFQVQAATSVNINNISADLVWYVLPIMAVVVALTLMRHRKFNVMSLGPQQAKGLGLAYEKELNINLVLIAVGMSVATALIGSLTFLGLLAVNAARELLKTYKHMPLFICSAMVAAFALVAGQGVMELIRGAIPVTAIINLVGCSYIFYLILKENRV